MSLNPGLAWYVTFLVACVLVVLLSALIAQMVNRR